MKKFVLLILSLSLLLSLVSCGEISAEETAEKLLNARVSGDIDTVVELTVNPYMTKNSDSERNAHKVWVQYYGDELTLSQFKILDTQEYSETELDALSDYLTKSANYPENSLEDAVKFNIKFTLKGKNRKSTLHRSVVMTKIDGKWYWGFNGETHPQTVTEILK